MFERVNEELGVFIANRPYCHIFASLFLAAICTISLKDARIENDIRTSFSPLNSRSSYEFAAYKEFFNLSVLPERSSILFSAKDGGSMLRLKQLEDVLILDKKYMSVLGALDAVTRTRGCDPQCELNLPFYKIAEELIKTYRKNEAHLSVNASASDERRLVVDYPFAAYQNHRIFMGMNLINVKVSNEIFAQNNSKIVSVKTIILWYFARADTPTRKLLLRNISLELFEAARKGNMLEHVNFEIFGDEIANTEMVRGAFEATMLMSIGFVLLLLFMGVCTHRKLRELYFIHILIIISISILCPLISSASAFGLITLCGRRIYTIMCVTPFLICGIGVDDAFIILQSWRQHSASTACCRRRLGMVLMHVGPSIAITSLTNTVAFGIGYFTPTPQMSLFCLCTSMAMFINYIFTLTILAPTLVLVSQSSAALFLSSAENINKSSLAVNGHIYVPSAGADKTEHAFKNGDVPLLTQRETLDERHVSAQAKSGLVDKDKHELEQFERLDFNAKRMEHIPGWIVDYSKFLCSARCRILSCFLLSLLLAIATFGIIRMKSTFEPSKAFPSDSPLSTSLSEIRTVFDEFFPINIFVHRPPNISDPIDHKLFYEMVEELETATDGYGKNQTLLWLRAYEDFDRGSSKLWEFIGIEYRPSYENLDFFLSHLNYPPSIRTEVDENGIRRLKAFQFVIIAKNMSEWLNRAVVEQKCREILLRYPFNATIYDGDSAVLNLLLTAKVDLVGSIIVTVVCMIVICSFFIAHKTGVIIMSITITFICYILVGMISWWGADLDPVTIVDVMLATGFSVDYTAHVAHQYYVKRGTPCEKIAQTLHEMILPTLEASTSTILCMLPLIFVPTYAIVAFAKTIFVVVAVGLAHGLFFMPLMLCALPHRSHKPKQKLLCFIDGNEERSKE